MTETSVQVLYEDNHIIIVNKKNNELVQKDRTGDICLLDKVKEYIKIKYDKPGEVYLGLPHRLDRPTSGIMIFARTSKALTRLNKMFKDHEIKKTYWAIVKEKPEEVAAELTHYLLKSSKKNKSQAFNTEKSNLKKAILSYELIAQSDNYNLLKINLKTGRHHQIRVQLSKIGCPIKGDLKYGFARSNKDGGISLHARNVLFTHPVKQEEININAPVPDDSLWKAFEELV